MPTEVTCPLCATGDPRSYRTASYLSVTVTADYPLGDDDWRQPTILPLPYPRPPDVRMPDTIGWTVGCPAGHVIATSADLWPCSRHEDVDECECDDMATDERQWWRAEDRAEVLALVRRLRGQAPPEPVVDVSPVILGYDQWPSLQALLPPPPDPADEGVAAFYERWQQDEAAKRGPVAMWRRFNALEPEEQQQWRIRWKAARGD